MRSLVNEGGYGKRFKEDSMNKQQAARCLRQEKARIAKQIQESPKKRVTISVPVWVDQVLFHAEPHAAGEVCQGCNFQGVPLQ